MLETITEVRGSTPSVDTGKQTTAQAFRIAVATSDDRKVDEHFGHAEGFTIYDVDAQGPRLLERREVAAHERGGEDRREAIYRMVDDCKIMLVAKIGAAPQEALAALGIEASDFHSGCNVEASLREVYAAKSEAASGAAVDASDFQLLHAMLRVADLDRSIDFYTKSLGMVVLERREHKKNQFSQAYLGYGPAGDRMTLELVFNWQREEPYVTGDGFGHVAIGVTHILRLCEKLAAAGVPMPRPPRAQRHGENIVAFIEDPDGHRIELIQPPQLG